MTSDPDVDLRALALLGRLVGRPGNARFRERLLKRESAAVLQRLAELEAAHASRHVMPTVIQAFAAAAPLEPPATIGPYRLVRRIGQGGMGDVWRAERDDGLFEQVVAIKLLQARLISSAGQAFESERRILARLSHPDIVRLIDGGITPDQQPYLIMDYVEGQPFSEVVAALPLARRIELLRAVASVVQYAHSRLVAHGDLKPANILVDARGRVRLLDFGIASLLGADGRGQSTLSAMTREFASPQRLAGSPASAADDVFALGRLLDLTIGTASDPDLRAVVDKACAPQEADRYDSVASLDADLARWQALLPVTARAATVGYVARRFIARNRRSVMVAALGVAALVGLTAFATVASVRARRASSEAAARFDDARGTARYLLFTLLDRLEEKPNTLALRVEAAAVAQHYLDRLSQAADASAEVRMETARGYVRLAEAQGVPDHPNIGDSGKALTNLEHGLQLLGQPRSPEAAEAVLTALIDGVQLDSYVNNNPDAALARLARGDAIAAAFPALPAMTRARLQVQRADALSWKSQYAQSKAAALAGVAMLGDDDGIDAVALRGKAWDLIAQADFGLNNGEAAADLRREVAIDEAGVRQFPDSRRIQGHLANALWQQGASDLDHPTPAALAELDRAYAITQQLSAFDADDEQSHRLATYVNADRATVLGALGHLDEGVQLLRANLALESQQSVEHPQELQWRRDHALDQGLLGRILTEGRRVGEGCAALAQFDAEIAVFARSGKLADMSLGDAIAQARKREDRYCRRS
jgi:serine/threonine-protein kinase